MRALVAVVYLAASVVALGLVRPIEREPPRSDTPALATAALKLRLTYGGLLVAAIVALFPASLTARIAVALFLFFASVPMLGHQAIGLTPARRHSRMLFRAWLLSAIYPPLVIAFGVALLVWS